MRRITAARMGLGVLLAVLFFGTLGALLFLQFLISTDEVRGEAAEVGVVVLRRDGGTRFDGTLLVDPPTALAALEAAGRAAAFDVRVVVYPNGRYVEAIGNETAEGSGGWLYRVEHAGASAYPGVAADRTALAAGDRVTWHWTDAPILTGS